MCVCVYVCVYVCVFVYICIVGKSKRAFNVCGEI